MLHAAKRYFHDYNGLPNIKVLKNIYQIVTQQLLNNRERYIKKHHNQQPSEPQLQAGDLILIKTTQPKALNPNTRKTSEDTGNNIEIWDFRGNISMVHVTDV